MGRACQHLRNTSESAARLCLCPVDACQRASAASYPLRKPPHPTRICSRALAASCVPRAVSTKRVVHWHCRNHCLLESQPRDRVFASARAHSIQLTTERNLCLLRGCSFVFTTINRASDPCLSATPSKRILLVAGLDSVVTPHTRVRIAWGLRSEHVVAPLAPLCCSSIVHYTVWFRRSESQ